MSRISVTGKVVNSPALAPNSKAVPDIKAPPRVVTANVPAKLSRLIFGKSSVINDAI
jgi:hypothetical protein